MARSFARKKHVQLTLDDARKPTGRGGWRRNAGRKKVPGAVSHDTREDMRAYHPQHITLRLVDGAPRLARGYLMKLIRPAISASHKSDFRINELNVLDNHLHLLVEASNKVARARGIQGLEVRIARRVNTATKRAGKLFAHRYHARLLRTPRDVRNVLRYILLNRKHHAAGTTFDKYWVDPFSSAPWFTGWAEAISRLSWTVKDLVATPPPTKPPDDVALDHRLEAARVAPVRRAAGIRTAHGRVGPASGHSGHTTVKFWGLRLARLVE